MKEVRFPMTRRTDIPEHPDDKEAREKGNKKSIQDHEKRVSREHKRVERSKNRKIKYGDDSPYIEDKKLFKAVSFARAILAEGKLPIEICMYRAAKHYKVPLNEVAKEMGRLGYLVRQKKLGY